MRKIVLKTAPRKTTVSRLAVRKAVTSAFITTKPSSNEDQSVVVKKKTVKKAAKKA